MKAVEHIGEHALAGQLGHFFALLSFAGALLAMLGFLLCARSADTGWRTVGRLGFRVHSAAVVGIIVTLFIMLFRHWFEFDYVWKHSNREMPLRYILSCFWEGQEGSFLLWTFWTMVLGNILLLRAREWETPVMTVFSLVQVFLASMLLGIYVFDVRIGSSPFLLIRELPENLGLPWTGLADYLTRIPQFADGRGLNPLLQNYWMVIHPPTLFLGFASTLIPFAYAIAGLWTGRRKDWLAPALPWTFFGIMVLGTGVLMGGAWAYEALSFGGFWAWDPVENASLVPWLTLVGTGHLILINKRKATSLFTTILLALGTFLLVLYSTFLTRSGVLGDTSVHSFTGEGMLPGLLVFMLAFVVLATTMLLADRQLRWYYALLSAVLLLAGALLHKQTSAILLFALLTLAMTLVAYFTGPEHTTTEEERSSSREFWLFIGSLVLLLSAIQITWTTSIPVFNLLAEPFSAAAKRAPPVDSIGHYNRWQLPIAVIVALLVAVGQYLRYKSTERTTFLNAVQGPIIAALLLTAGATWWLRYSLEDYRFILLFFATAFAFTANAGYILSVLKGALPKAGPSVAHVGFALVLMGALVSTSRQKVISHNTQAVSLEHMSDGLSDSKNMMIYLGDTVPVGDHFVTYRGRRQQGVNMYFDMDYLQAVPRTFHRGDTVRVRSSLFVARDDHHAGDNFLTDQPEHWQPLDSAARRVFWNATVWSATAPGPMAFALEPLVQLNPRFGNVAEPSTRHWPARDLYTHIRYAKLDQNDTTDFMPPRSLDRMIGDTVLTANCVVVLDSLRAVRDSVTISRLGPDYTVYVVKLKVRDLRDPSRWFEARPVSVYWKGQPVGAKGAEVPQLRTRFDITTVQGQRIGLNISEREFVIVEAILFPGINILWIGCILMALGSFMAIRQRWKRSS